MQDLSEPVKRRLAQITTDEGFVAAVELAHRASMSSTEAFTFVTEVNELRSSAKQVAFIQDRVADLSDRIGSTGGGVLNRKPQGPKARLNMAVGSILNLPDDPSHIVQEHMPSTHRITIPAGRTGVRAARRGPYSDHPSTATI